MQASHNLRGYEGHLTVKRPVDFTNGKKMRHCHEKKAHNSISQKRQKKITHAIWQNFVNYIHIYISIYCNFFDACFFFKQNTEFAFSKKGRIGTILQKWYEQKKFKVVNHTSSPPPEDFITRQLRSDRPPGSFPGATTSHERYITNDAKQGGKIMHTVNGDVQKN